MSAKYTFLAWSTKVKDSSTKLALLQLANNADDSGFSYYSISKMALSCNMSERSFMRKIKTLEESRILTVERRSNRPSLYTLVGDEMGVTICHDQYFDVTACHPGVTACHLVGDSVSPDLNSTLNTTLNKVTINICSTASNVSELKKINDDNIKKEKIIKMEYAFNYFWENMGMRKASKPTAIKAFSRAFARNKGKSVSEFSKMLVHDTIARKTANQIGFSNRLPASYLNQDGFNDDFQLNALENGKVINHESNGMVINRIKEMSEFFQ